MNLLNEERKKDPKPVKEIEWKPDKSQIVHLQETYEELSREKKKQKG